jgi:RES domain-containing protein
VPPEFTLLKIDGPELEVVVVKAEDLPQDWRIRPDATRDLGTVWLRKKEGVLLKVPSAIVPETANFLFNPMHMDAAKFRITDVFKMQQAAFEAAAGCEPAPRASSRRGPPSLT